MTKLGWSLPPGVRELPDEAPTFDEGAEEHAKEKLLAALAELDSGRWHWERIHCCWTGKDADLEPWGDQGLEVVKVDEHGVEALAHGCKTIVGREVCINTPSWASGKDAERAIDVYEDAMQEIVSFADSAGEWDGDDWIMTCEETVVISWVWPPAGEETGEPDYQATAARLVEYAQEALDPWEREMISIDKAAEELAGWSDEHGKRAADGYPPRNSAWAHWEAFERRAKL